MPTCIVLARLGWHMTRERAGAQLRIRYDGTGVARDVQQPLGKWISCAPFASANLTKNEFLPYELYGGNDFELHRIVGAMLPHQGVKTRVCPLIFDAGNVMGLPSTKCR